MYHCRLKRYLLFEIWALPDIINSEQVCSANLSSSKLQGEMRGLKRNRVIAFSHFSVWKRRSQLLALLRCLNLILTLPRALKWISNLPISSRSPKITMKTHLFWLFETLLWIRKSNFLGSLIKIGFFKAPLTDSR